MISNANYLKSFHDEMKALGDKEISSDFTFEIEGYETSVLLCKQAPWALTSVGGEIEVPGILGSVDWQPQQIKTNLQSPVSFQETVKGSVSDMLIALLQNGGTFDAKVYAGTPDNYTRYKRLRKCFMVLDTPDRDLENRSQVLVFSGTLFFHYFNDDVVA